MRLIYASKKKTDARYSFSENQWQKETNTPRFERNEKLILIFVLLVRRGIKIGSQRLRIFVCNCSTIVTPKKALFDVTSLFGDLVIAHRTNFVVIVPKAFGTFHDQCPRSTERTRLWNAWFHSWKVKATLFCSLLKKTTEVSAFHVPLVS